MDPCNQKCIYAAVYSFHTVMQPEEYDAVNTGVKERAMEGDIRVDKLEHSLTRTHD